MLIDNKYYVVIYSKMITSNFFTILQKYFHCCMCRCCMTETEENRNGQPLNASASASVLANNNRNPFTFDDMSNPSTPMTWSSSNSSLDSSNDPSLYLQSSSSYYKRKNIHIGIIPSSYYPSEMI
jgi:hypothetical protein